AAASPRTISTSPGAWPFRRWWHEPDAAGLPSAPGGDPNGSGARPHAPGAHPSVSGARPSGAGLYRTLRVPSPGPRAHARGLRDPHPDGSGACPKASGIRPSVSGRDPDGSGALPTAAGPRRTDPTIRPFRPARFPRIDAMTTTTFAETIRRMELLV